MVFCFGALALGFAVFSHCVLLFGCCVWLRVYYGCVSGFWCLLYSVLSFGDITLVDALVYCLTVAWCFAL